MNKIIILLLLLFASCTAKLEETVLNPERETTVELLNLKKDTVIISTNNNHIYIFKDNLLQYKAIACSDKTTANNILIIVISIIIVIKIIISILIFKPKT